MNSTSLTLVLIILIILALAWAQGKLPKIFAVVFG